LIIATAEKRASVVSATGICDYEQGASNVLPADRDAMRAALERAGVGFIGGVGMKGRRGAKMSGINIEVNQEGTSVIIKLLPERARSIKLSADQLLRLIQQLESFHRELIKEMPTQSKKD
jgi:hypothetical protein